MAPAWLACAGCLPAAPPLGPAAWALMWSDEFDGSALDSSRWKWGSLPWGGTVHNSSYASAVTAADSYLEGGVLKLRCRKVTTDGKPWTEGFVHTQGKLDYTYGYAEIRAKYPHSKGTWPAFWMLSWSSGWPPEIDVAEYFGSENRMHYGLCTGTSGSPVWDSTNGYDDAAGWHTYGIEWGPGYLKWYRDGDLRKTVTGSVVPSPDMYLMLNSGMNWSHDGTTPNPNYYQVDHVRVYKRSQAALNGKFESGNAPWSRRNGAGVVAGQGTNDSAAMRILTDDAGDGAAEQTAWGLLADTDYVVSAGVRSNGWATLNIGAKNFGGAETRTGRSSSAWGVVATPFTTGAGGTTARLYAWLPAGWATAYVDDFRLTRAAAAMNPGLETGEENTFWDTAGDVFVHNWSTCRRSGQWALRLNNPDADRSAAQFVAGLKPSTSYQWSCWMRTHNQLLRLGVRAHGEAESYTGKTGANWAWTRHRHTFTTGPSNTTATVYAAIPAANHTSVVDVDDFFLAETLPAPWTLTDVGDVGLASDAGARGARLALRAGGTGPGGSADSGAFVHQPLAGDGGLVVRVRTLEGAAAGVRCGLMLRESTAAGAAGAWLGWRANGTVEFIRRTTTDSAAGSNPLRAGNTPANVHDTVRVAVTTAAGLDEWSVTDGVWTKTRTISPGWVDTVTWHNGWFYAVAGADVVRIDPATGTRAVLAGRPLAGWTDAQGRDLEVGPDGRLYFATTFGSTAGEGVYRLNLDGTGFARFIPRSGGTPPDDWELDNAIGLAWVGNDLYVSSRAASGAANRPIYRFTTTGTLAAKFTTFLTGPMGLCPDGADLAVGGSAGASALVSLRLADAAVNYTRSGSFSVDVAAILGELHTITHSSGAGGRGSILKAGPDPAMVAVNNDLGATGTDLVVMPVTAYQAWALDHGINPQDRGGAPADDYDGDGTPNEAEFALGLDPTDGTSRFAVTRSGTPATGIMLAWPSRPGLTFTVRSSTDLSDWSTVAAVVPAAAAPAAVTSWTSSPLAGPRRFFRVEVSP